MLTDLVIDTNVLVHSQNPQEPRHPDSVALLQALLDSTALLCVDEGFACDPGANRSHIGSEYLNHLRAGSLALTVVTRLAQTNRIRQLARTAPPPTKKRVNQMIANRRDRIFLSVAFNSGERILASHDYTDFQVSKRGAIEKELGVHIIEARDCEPRLR